YDTIFGASGNDTLLGLGGDDFLAGATGNDSMDGGAGNDALEGGEGNETVIGGLGQDELVDSWGGFDHFVFNVAPTADNVDRVGFFASGSDKIHLDGGVFANAGASGNFTSNDPRFYAGQAAHDADDRVIYDGRN